MVVELLHRADKPEVALLYQVEEEHSASDVFFRNADDEAKVGLDEGVLARRVARLYALRELDFVLRGQKRNLAYLAQVHAHGVGKRQVFEVAHIVRAGGG